MILQRQGAIKFGGIILSVLDIKADYNLAVDWNEKTGDECQIVVKIHFEIYLQIWGSSICDRKRLQFPLLGHWCKSIYLSKKVFHLYIIMSVMYSCTSII